MTARTLKYELRADAAPWTCDGCGETAAEPQFTQCWRCGAYRETESAR